MAWDQLSKWIGLMLIVDVITIGMVFISIQGPYWKALGRGKILEFTDPVCDSWFIPKEPAVISKFPVLDIRNFVFSYIPTTEHRTQYGYSQKEFSSPVLSVITTISSMTDTFIDANCILNQSLQSIEWIIMIESRSENNIFIEKLRKDPRIRIEYMQGDSSTLRNAGITLAQCPYIVFVQGEDCMELVYFEKAVWFLETHPQFTMVNSFSVSNGYYEKLDMFRLQNINSYDLMDLHVPRSALLRASVFEHFTWDNLPSQFEAEMRFWINMLVNGQYGFTIPEFLVWDRTNTEDIDIHEEAIRANLSQEFSQIASVKVPSHQAASGALVDYKFSFPNTLAPSKKPRILFVINAANFGGADTFNLNIMDGLVRAGWEISLVVLRAGTNALVPHYMKYTSDVFVLGNFLSWNEHPRFIAYLINSRKFDITLITNSEDGYLYLPYLKAFAPDTIYVDYCHSEEPDWKLGGYVRYSIQFQSILSRSLYASNATAQWAIRNGHNAEKVAVVHNGVDTESFTRNVAARKDIRALHQISDDTRVVCYIARIEEGKLPFVYANVMERLVKLGLHYHSFIMGGGSLQDQLMDKIHGMGQGVSSKITFLGTQPAEKMKKLLSACDVVFLPSKREGISLALMEGMSASLVPVSVDIGGQAELVCKECGFLINYTDDHPQLVTEFTEKLADLIQHEAKLNSMARHSKEVVNEHFSIKTMVENFIGQLCIARNRPFQPVNFTEILLETTRTDAEYLRMQKEYESVATKYKESLNSASHIATAPLQPLGVHFQQGVMLVAFGASSSSKKGEQIHLTLVWSANNGPTELSYITFIHFKQGDSIAFQGDRQPISHNQVSPSNTWKKGDIIVDTGEIMVPEWVVPGSYDLTIGLFELTYSGRLFTMDGRDQLFLQSVTILA